MGRTVLWCVLVVAGTAAAQQRRPAFVTVVDADGKALAGAEVTCVFTPDTLNPWTIDIVRQAADARGRARCDLQLGRVYAAWAIGPADEKGCRSVSATVPVVTAGRTFDLATRYVHTPRRLRLGGHAAWRAVGAKGLRWFPDAGEDVSHELPWPADDVVELPPSPCSEGCLALVDAAGELMVVLQVESVAAELEPFAPPIEVNATVRDTFGKPIAGVRIDAVLHRRLGPQRLLRPLQEALVLRACGTTDATGSLRVHVAAPPVRMRDGRPMKTAVALLASKAGFACVAERTEHAGTVPFTLPPATVHTLRVAGDSARASDVKVVAHRKVNTLPSQDWRIDAFAPTERTGSTWRVHDVDRGCQVRVRLDESPPALLAPARIEKPGAEVDIDLAATPPIAVRAIDPDGNPSACAIGITSVMEGSPLMYWNGVGSTDPAGRATLRLPGGPWCVYATTGRAHALALVEAPQPRELTLRLLTMSTLRVRVVGESGEPVAGARFWGWSLSLGDSPGDATEQQWRHFAQCLSGSYATIAGSDRDGLLEFPAFPEFALRQLTIICGARSASLATIAANGDTEVVLHE